MIDQVPLTNLTKMNVLYTSQKLQELFSDEQVPLHANASGDGDGVPGRCCRLCGGDTNLRYFGDTYVWEGVEERYDQLLYDCFGVRVTPSDCMICEWCVRALRNTERFRALVHAAFDRPPSDLSSSLTTLKSNSCLKPEAKLSTKLDKEVQPKKPLDIAKKREVKKRTLVNEAKSKRMNIPCEVCKQRYPMLVHNDDCKTFICSRCKKNGELKGSVCRKCNIMMPNNMMKEHLELHAKADQRGKNRANQARKNQLPIVNSVTKQRPQKYQCSRCPKKYAVAKNLVLHVRHAHGDSLDTLCSVCGQDLETRERLEDHLADHTTTTLHQCDACLLIFKNKKSLATHSLSHHLKPTS